MQRNEVLSRLAGIFIEKHGGDLIGSYPMRVTGRLVDVKVPAKFDPSSLLESTGVLHRFMLRNKSMTAKAAAAVIVSGSVPCLMPWKAMKEVHQVLALQSAEAERIFSTMQYLKDKIRNRLSGQNLNIALRGFSSRSSMEDQDYDEVYEFWQNASSRGRYVKTKIAKRKRAKREAAAAEANAAPLERKSKKAKKAKHRN